MAIFLTSSISIILLLALHACSSRTYSPSLTRTGSIEPVNATSSNTGDSSIDEDQSSMEQPGKDEAPASTPAAKTNTPAAPDSYCSATAIVGGTPATMNDMVTKSTIQLVIGQGTCTGALIGPNQISTAAHCLETNPAAQTIQIRFGLNPTANPNIKVKGYSVHPDYTGLGITARGYPARRLYDVAVISFEGKLPAGYRVAPVGSTINLTAGTEVTVAGYGAYSERDMMQRPLTLVKKQVALFDRNYKEIQLQVGGGTGACYGDSGGPSYVLSENGMCLHTLSTTTGPGRTSNGVCDQGHGTLMDITAHQGWMSCAFEKLGTPLPYLVKDESKEACVRTVVK